MSSVYYMNDELTTVLWNCEIALKRMELIVPVEFAIHGCV